MTWLTTPAHHRWLESESARLLDFGRGSRHPRGGFGGVDAQGTLAEDADAELWITCRMTHCYALATLMGRPGSAALVDHGIDALRSRLRDDEHGGWFAAVGAEGPTDDSKQAYAHAFVVLAASSAAAAGRPEARDLLDEALEVIEKHFWDDDAQTTREDFSRDWEALEDYRGLNSTMHMVEAFIAAADVTGERVWLDRATRIVERVMYDLAPRHDWRLPEHFDSAGTVQLDYNADDPKHPFRPFGATIGHGFEWARLTVQLAVSLQQRGLGAPEWMVDSARALYDASARDGWTVDGQRGFVYTVDWEGQPVVRERMHWVSAEAIAAAAVLWRATKVPMYAENYQEWWDFVGDHHLDLKDGSWWHELDPHLQVAGTVWPGKVDLYHALQATLIPRLPVTPSLASSLAAGNLP
ncbi:AGE family epimerase/isomerase [Demequina globuliformis]|uniref:AGE family epimerase/isomerase n=1 Tax=Demequina globuliformis TaxID=676202 RepID=UPI000782471F|nr:AGE family epimerase/isomerase [Demequina globuliformis]